MGKQLSLLLTNEDLVELDSVLRRAGDTAIYFDHEDDRLVGKLPPMPSIAMSESEIGHSSLMCIVAPNTANWRVRIEQHSAVKRTVNIAESDVIELWRPYCHEGLIRRGRLWYEPRPWIDGGFADKSEAFVRWAERVLARVRRSFPYDKSLASYVGRVASACIASGEIEVVN